MSTPVPPPAPLAPPEEEFWERYSPHHEFPLSSIGSVALHIAGLVLVLLMLWLLSRLSFSTREVPPMHAVRVQGDGDGAGAPGGGGGEANRQENNVVEPVIPKRSVPQADLDRVIPEVTPFLPQVPNAVNGPKPEDLKNLPKLAGLDEELRKRMLPGQSGKKGAGEGAGSGGPGPEGAGAGTAGDASSAANRSVRWELNFTNKNGDEYLRQLAAMKATLIFPEPPNWKTNRAYSQLIPPQPNGEPFDINSLTGKLYFVDDEVISQEPNGKTRTSAGRLASALHLRYEEDPPRFIALFPKDIEEELARLERAYRGRKENEIFSTTFRVLVRDGKPSITVIDQVPVRR
jgi:hypothetical protein